MSNVRQAVNPAILHHTGGSRWWKRRQELGERDGPEVVQVAFDAPARNCQATVVAGGQTETDLLNSHQSFKILKLFERLKVRFSQSVPHPS